MIHADITDTPPEQMELAQIVAEIRTVNVKLDQVLRMKARDGQEKAEFERVTRKLQVRWSILARHLMPIYEDLKMVLRR